MTYRTQLLADRYRLLAPLRRGTAGIMWQAYDLRLKRDVAIKEVPPPYRVDRPDVAAARRRALREARAVARLSHPGILTVHDLLEQHGRLWIVTELLHGLSLKETVAHLGRLPAHWTAWVGFQVVAGLQHAHAAGVLHGDIKPETVLLTEDRVVLTDFGIAGTERDSATSTTVPLTGSAGYVAPERIRGERPTPAADLWSLGATLYMAVEGRPPFSGPGPLAVLGTALTREPDPPRHAGSLRPVLERLLQRDPVRRLTAEQTAALLAEVLRREGVSAAPPAIPPVGGRPHQVFTT